MARGDSEFGGAPGNVFDHAGMDGFEVKALRGSPVPHMERQALTEVTGGREVLTQADGTPITQDPRYGQAGTSVRSYTDD